MLAQPHVEPAEEDRAAVDQVVSAVVGHIGHRNALVVVLARGQVLNPPGCRRARSVSAREDAFEPAESRRVEPRARHESLHALGELLAAGPALQIHHSANQPAVGHRHRITKRVDVFHRLERQVQRRDAGCRIGDIESVERDWRLIRARAAQLHQSVCAADHRGQQRQRFTRLHV